MSKRGKWLMEAVRSNWELKLLALLLAFVTYYAIRGATGYEVEYTVPVEVETEPGFAVLSMNPEVVDVRFRGSRDDLLKLDQKSLKAGLRVREENMGGVPRAVAVTPRNIQGAPGVNVAMIDPPRVLVAFDREVETTFNVAKPATLGLPLLGKAEIQYSPQVVTVRGPKARIDELRAEGQGEVTTDPVDVDGRVESFSKRVRVHPPGGAWASKIDPEEITVQVTIIKKSTTREWSSQPVLAVRGGDDRGSVQIDPPMVDVVMEGRSELLESVSASDLRLFVDCVGLEPAGVYELPVQVHLPVSMDVTVSVTPKVVTVTFLAHPGE